MKVWAIILLAVFVCSCNERKETAPNFSTVDSNAIDPPDSPAYNYPDSLDVPLEEGPMVQPKDTVKKK